MFDDDDDVVQIREWLIDGDVMRPSVSYMRDVCKWYSNNVSHDVPVSFIFHSSYNAENALIHESRLQMAGGPLAALTGSNFEEGKEKSVSLCEEDDPGAFQIIRSFLYGAEIDVSQIDLTELVRIATCSHRWGLTTLVHLISRYICIEDMIKDSSDVLQAKRIAELENGENDFECYFWESTGQVFDQLSPSFSSDPNGVIDDTSFPWPATSVQKYPELFEDVWKLAISKGYIEVLFDNILWHASRKTKSALLYVIAAVIEPLLEEDSILLEILRCILHEAENLTSLLQTKIFLQLASVRMLSFILAEFSRLSSMRKQAYDTLNGMVSSSFWEVPLVYNGVGERKLFFTQSAESNVGLWQSAQRGRRLLFPNCESTSSDKTPSRLEAFTMINWRVASSHLKVDLKVRNSDCFPDPFMARLFLRTAQCRCKSRCELHEHLCSHIIYRRQESDSVQITGSWEVQAESLKHNIEQNKHNSDPCVVTLHVVVGHYH